MKCVAIGLPLARRHVFGRDAYAAASKVGVTLQANGMQPTKEAHAQNTGHYDAPLIFSRTVPFSTPHAHPEEKPL